MPKPSKEVLRQRLRDLGAVPPPDADWYELAALVKRVQAIKDQQPVAPPSPRPRPKFTPSVTVSPSAGETLTRTRISDVDHHRRTWDPMAGW